MTLRTYLWMNGANTHGSIGKDRTSTEKWRAWAAQVFDTFDWFISVSETMRVDPSGTVAPAATKRHMIG
jgi:hypothetical protein